MKHQLLALAFLLCVYLFPATEAKQRGDYLKYNLLKGSHCEFTGYVPGGKKVTVERITAPTATLEKDILSGLAGNLGQAGEVASEAMKKVKVFGKLASIAPKLAPVLGMFGVGMSIVEGFTTPSPADILNAANKAIAKLTTEVNDRLEEMKGYVDQKTINLEKDLVSREYQSLFSLWSNCLTELTKAKVDECQEDATKAIIAARPHFALFSSDVEAKNLEMSVYDVKRIEASLITFRDYVTLNLAALSTLAATYKNEHNKVADYNRWANNLNNEIKRSIKYAGNAVAIILYMHTGGDHCKESMDIAPVKPIEEGWLNIHTADQTTVKCVIDRGELPTHTCGYKLWRRADGKTPSGYRKIYTPTSSGSEALKYKGKKLVEAYVSPYIKTMKSAIINYWSNEILDMIPSWKELKIKLAADQVLSEDAIMESRNSEQYSDSFERRVQVATHMQDAYEIDEQYENQDVVEQRVNDRNVDETRFPTGDLGERFDVRGLDEERFDASDVEDEKFGAPDADKARFDAGDLDERFDEEGFDASDVEDERFDIRGRNGCKIWCT